MFGDFTLTNLRPNTITVVGSAGNDTVDLTSLLSAHRIVFKSKGGNDVIIGALRPQDVIELADGKTLDDYNATINTNGSTTLSSGGHSVTFFSTGGSPQFAPGEVPANGNTPNTQEDNPTNPGDGDDDGDNPSGNNGNNQETTPPPAGTGGTVIPGVVYMGTAANDVGVGGATDDTLVGALGDDTLFGLGGNDNLAGGDGDDQLISGDGKDIVIGDAGNDTVLAGAGDDTVLAGSGDDTVFGDDGDDLLFGHQGRDVINAGAGNDTVFAAAGDGDDVIHGDIGVDTLDLQAITADLTVDLGSNGSGWVSSDQSGYDTLNGIENVKGGAGDDTIYASSQVNILNGGAGADIFVFNTASAAQGDVVEGFAPGDTIDLRPFMPNFNDTDVLGSGATFNAAGGQVRLTVQGTDTLIEGNTDADADVEFVIKVAGRTNLSSADFA